MAQLKLEQVYVIDADALINIGRWYPRDMKIFEPIWAKLEELVDEELLISHYEVYREVSSGYDYISEWCKKHSRIFKDVDDEQISIFEKVREVYDKNYWDRNITNPNPWADPWIIALAVQNKAIIVTNENKEKPNRIPSVARAFGINSLKPIEFFKEIGIQ
ncbi:hypothetical protein Asulf_01390 [Archaeoglobus sulfaticallidus PM70-1]|uniref:Nucleic acid-binding protein, contains PIN domain n=1 Tax=Archaeoglobus sulfaticallidus PM70-1 TaxID=387631 RepID=N0BLG0_9EURY|nr:DUF4411 family protein [Archaeoglobus sulfaticallidus]AGK61381.1 hypothetical protein Asulf_01390 [Archaeoglobus sulfaticallidus PM70-1]